MAKDSTVSIIIPVYNMEPWLRECLDSVVNQSLREIEIICVNDGSTDGSAAILREYAAHDERILILEQENRGLSEARNAGLRVADGKYLFFLDSDDVLEPESMQVCAENMEQRGLDCLCFNTAAFGEDPESAKEADRKNRAYYCRLLDDETISTGQELFVGLKQSGAFVSTASTVMVARSFLTENHIEFFPGILHEDELWMFQTLLLAGRAGCMNRIVYRRRIREGSIVTSAVSFRNVYGCWTAVREAQRFLLSHPVLTAREEYRSLEIEHILQLQKAAARQFIACSEEEKRKYRDLPPEEQLEFEKTVIYLASPTGRTEQKHEEIKMLKQQRDDLKNEQH